MKRRGWKDVAKIRTPDLTDCEAADLAKKWFGPNGSAERCDDEDMEPCAIGFWRVDPFAEDGCTDLDYYSCEGIGQTWAAAFRRADPKRWQAYRITRLARAAAGSRRP